MTFSEFGRRVAENANGGTWITVRLRPCFGRGDQARIIWHKYPSLTDLDHGDLKFNTDLRSYGNDFGSMAEGAKPGRAGPEIPAWGTV